MKQDPIFYQGSSTINIHPIITIIITITHHQNNNNYKPPPSPPSYQPPSPSKRHHELPLFKPKVINKGYNSTLWKWIFRFQVIANLVRNKQWHKQCNSTTFINVFLKGLLKLPTPIHYDLKCSLFRLMLLVRP